MIVSEQPVT